MLAQRAMTPERWKQVEQLFHDAQAMPPAERAAFVRTASSDDDIRREVESLLSEGDAESGLLGYSLTRATLGLTSVGATAGLAGKTLGSYQVQSLLGLGGMGEVYRARDAKLERDVAIKILPPAFMNDPDRLARFAREARMLASVNHPGICSIYGIDDADGMRVLVLELVDGLTLAETLSLRAASGEAGLPVGDAIGIGRQIAEALEVAHDKGIIHRDLKPANIKITPQGTVKVLDFGLAKAVGGDGSSPDLSSAPLEGVRREGAVVGTAAYMSPEQARGLPVDKRTDIWAFGCVLSEMLSGRGPFAGDTASDSLAKVID